MSSGKTETLGLNQWQLSDAFLMEEMNADNRKVDAAVKTLGGKAEFVPLKTFTTQANPSGVSQIDVQVSDIDFTDWQFVIMDCTIPATGGCALRVNNKNTGTYYVMNSISSYSGGLIQVNGYTRVIFFTGLGVDSNFISAMGIRDVLCYGRAQEALSSLAVLNFIPPSNFPISQACTFSFWGVK